MNCHANSRPIVSTLLVALTFTLATDFTADAADWPQWRGPARTGVSTESSWSSTGMTDNVWTAEVGLGYSSVAVAAGRLYTAGWKDEKDTVYCMDASTGAVVWSHSYPAKAWNRFHKGGTLTTPSIDGDRVYTLNREGRFSCFDAADGTVHWSRNLMDELELTHPTWGFAASPLVLDDMIVINVGRVLAVKKTGETIWQTRDLGHAYSTPVDLTVAGRPSLAVFNGNGLALIDRETGRELGHHAWKTKYDVNGATPVVVGDKVFISSGYGRGCAMIQCKLDGLSVVWESKVMRTQMSGCVLWEGHLYGFDESILKCINLEGKEQWRVRGIGKGSLMVADGRLIVIGSKGELIIAKATPDAYTELSRTKCLSGGVYWTMPVLVDGRIYCRSSQGSIVCRDHRANTSAVTE